MDWESGTITGSEQLIIAPGATLNFDNPAEINFSGSTLENQGTVNWIGSGIIANGGAITNDVGAQFQIFGSRVISYAGGTAQFDNAGTLILADNATTSFEGVAFNDYGTVDFPSGTLTLNGGGILGSLLTVPAASVISFGSGTFTSTTIFH